MTALSPSAKALACSMRILAMRDHSENELRRKLIAYSENPPQQRLAKASRRTTIESAEDETETMPERRVTFPTSTSPLFSSEDIDATLAYCYQHGWLDDDRFAQRYIRDRSQRGYGAVRIKAELVQRGVARTVISQALAECEIDWFALAYDAAERKCGGSFPDNWQEKTKLQRYLQTRGFSHEEIQSIYTNFSD